MGGAPVTFISPEADMMQAVRQTRYGSELWQYFLAAAIIAMLVEMWLGRSGGQTTTSVGKPSPHETTSIAT
jgi:hypothetical protein